MDGGISQPVGDLGEIQLIAANQLLGCIDFHQSEKLHHPATMLLLKQLLQAGTTDESIFTNIFNGQLLIDMLFHITDNPVVCLIRAPQTGILRILNRHR